MGYTIGFTDKQIVISIKNNSSDKSMTNMVFCHWLTLRRYQHIAQSCRNKDKHESLLFEGQPAVSQ